MTETDMNLNGIAELDDTTSPAGDPLEHCLKVQTGFDGIVGKSAGLRHVLRLVDTAARGGATVLFLGETGTGKFVARAIHNRSHRKDRPFTTFRSQSSPSSHIALRKAAGEPVAGAKVTVFTPGAKKNLTAVTGTDGRFAIADLRLGPNRVSVELPGRGPTGQVGVNITGVTVVLTVSDQNVSLVVDSRELRVGD